MEGYTQKVLDSSREFSKKEMLMYSDNNDAIALDKLSMEYKATGEQLVIVPLEYIVLAIHNDRNKGDKDYNQLIIVDENGNKYITGSRSFTEAFINIWENMEGESDWGIKVCRRESKNYSGKDFLTCVVC